MRRLCPACENWLDALAALDGFPNFAAQETGQPGHFLGNRPPDHRTLTPDLHEFKIKRSLFSRRNYHSFPSLPEANGLAVAYVYYEEEPGRRAAANLLTKERGGSRPISSSPRTPTARLEQRMRQHDFGTPSS